MVFVPILLFSVIAGCEESIKPATFALQQNDPSKALALLEPLRSSCALSSAFNELLGLASELAGNKSAAEEAFRTAVSLDKRSSRLLTELGATLLRNGKTSEAGKILDQALALDPSNMATLKYSISVAVEARRWPRASELFDQMRRKDNYATLQQEPILFLWFAQTLLQTSQSGRINSVLSPQRKFMPPGLLFSIGTLFAQHRLYQLAIDYLGQIPQESADDAVAFNLGLCYSHLEQYDESRRCYFQAIDKHPGHIDAYFHVGLDYAAGGEPQMGIPWLFRANCLAPARPDIAYALAEQLIALEYFNTARQLLTETSTIAPHDALLVTADGDLKRAQGDAAAAINSYQSALVEKPGLTASVVGLARANVALGKDKDARASLATALSSAPQDPFLNGELGLLDANQGDWEAASFHLSRAWAQNRSNPDIALALARAYQRKNQPLEALKVLQSVPPLMRDSPAFHFELSQLYIKLHRPADAQTERATFTALQNSDKDVLRFEKPQIYVH